MTSDKETTLDAFRGGRLKLRQPLRGHRFGTDTVLLAAAARPKADSRIVDIGAGVGTVGLSLILNATSACATLIEIDETLAGFARQNADDNGLGDRAVVKALDVASYQQRAAAGVANGAADLVVTNPPFYSPSEVQESSDPLRATAHVLARVGGQSPLAPWLNAAFALLAPGGRFVMIHRPERLPAILEAAAGHIGAVAILPIYPYAGRPAHRILISGIKGSRAPMGIRDGLVLHDRPGRFSATAEAIHRGEANIEWR
jgi:tRNA1(Val) A37 N6-methylase TrmN6